MKRKWLAVGIILLFVGFSVSSIVNASTVDNELLKIKHNSQENLVKVNCYEFKSDGSIEKTTILLPKSAHFQMRQALSLTTSLEKKLEVYKKYGIVPSDASIQNIKENYNQYLSAKKINIPAIPKLMSSHEIIQPSGIMVNNHCEIAAVVGLGINVNLGMSAWTQWWNGFWAMIIDALDLYLDPPYSFFIPGIDLYGFSICMRTFGWTWNGTLSDTQWDFGYGTMLLLGFIGYYVEEFPLPLVLFIGEYVGYTVSVMAAGLMTVDDLLSN
ncbi:MAG: hypothetical protein MUC80_03020 [Candidatus Thermoplasmatota archaeon]|jgi:hypothetical protein|nr:hypothetical protein [Candidatus Thermoplasmatota archaeon]